MAYKKSTTEQTEPAVDVSLQMGQTIQRQSPQSVIDAYQQMAPDARMGQHARQNYDSSVPLNDLKDQTEGLSPRSREPFTRESDERSKRFIDYYQNTSQQIHKGKTHMPEEFIPEGYVFMWARESCRGRPDQNNLQELENRHGWEYMSASQCPQFAYYDDYGNLNDSATRVRRGGLIGMIRRKEIHEAQMSSLARLRNSDKRMEQVMRTTDGDLHPFSNHSTEANSNFFPSDDMSRSFASSFSY